MEPVLLNTETHSVARDHQSQKGAHGAVLPQSPLPQLWAGQTETLRGQSRLAKVTEQQLAGKEAVSLLACLVRRSWTPSSGATVGIAFPQWAGKDTCFPL